ncbi:hypothetical protein [uncultured Chryseobacterium sp.]|uniref:hypothetical protein n=1 Tax=uncultured Chryseobacterium sp. TaxID=259322 RepID=UPI0026116B10|nr:hypothetical protein [uncultured Chryseobacterium sp.]
MELAHQVGNLLLLALPVACMAWTVTHEEIFREPREYCLQKSKTSRSLAERKFFYLFTCEYCFSHYVTLFLLIFTGFKLVYDDWRGYVVAFFALVWIANLYMTLFGILRQMLKVEKLEGNLKDNEWREVKEEIKPDDKK